MIQCAIANGEVIENEINGWLDKKGFSDRNFDRK